MYKKKKKQLISYFLCAVLSFSMIAAIDEAAAKKPKLSSKKITLKIKQRKVLKVKNTKKKIRWKVISGKSRISVKKKGKTSFVIRGKKKGAAKIRFTIGKKKLYCKITVKAANNKKGPKVNASQAPKITPGPTDIPKVTPAPTDIPKTTPAPTDIPKVTPAPTDIPKATPAPTEIPKATPAPTEIPKATPVPTEIPKATPAPTEIPKATPAPTEIPKATPAPTEIPKATPAPTDISKVTPSPTNILENADKQDLAAAQSLIQDLTKGGATVQDDLSSDEYIWEDGRLTEIHWDSKNLTGDLDVSSLTALKSLLCSGNKLTSLNVSKNTALTELNCAGNALQTLNVADNAGLTKLFCGDNELSCLDISKNTALRELSCWGNTLSRLDISKNAALTELNCAGNPLTALDVSKNTSLVKLNCSDIASANLDVTKNTALKELSCWGNALSSLDISQNGHLEKLSCGENSLSHLDISKNSALIELSCGGNPLDGLDVSANTALTKLSCERNGLNALDISANDKLQELSCDDNRLNSLNVSKNTALTKLACSSNQLKSLDVTKNTALLSLSCKDNSLQSLNLKENTKLTDLAQDSSVAVDGYDPLSHMVKNYEIPDSMKWWAYGKFGMFIHFGAYSEYGQGEWAMSEQRLSREKYQSQCIASFNPAKFNADEIAKCAKAAGMKYIVITAKHHEGFCMWDTQVESFKDYTGSKTFSLQKFSDFGATGRDVLQELKTACEKEGLKFGLYYSIVDWNHSSQTLGGSLSSTMSSMETRASYITDMKAQLRELIERYDPAVFWFDGDWTYSDKEPTLQKWWTKSDGVDLYNYMKSLNPNVIINERVCRSFGLGDFECPERQIPSKYNVPKRAWETCQSMNAAWGYKKSLENSYYSSDKLIQDLITVASEGGNYLLNIGPKGSGEMTDGSRNILNAFSQWIKVKGESIYNVAPSPFRDNPSWGTYTRKGNIVYAHVRNWQEANKLTTERYDGKKIDRITILGKSCELNYRVTEKNIIIQMPKNVSNENNLVIAIQYK